MVSTECYSDATAADKSSIGFDYQYYFFLWKVLCLQPGQSAGLECKDDVHTDLDNDIQVLYQLKHTIKKSKVTTEPVNLTTMDDDLWKTLSNWAKLIKNPISGRGLPYEQLEFINKTLFVLASNKSETKKNEVALLINKTINGEVGAPDLKSFIQAISDKSTSKSITKYSAEILSLSEDVLYQFIKKISFELGEEYIISKCHNAIKAKMINDKDLRNAFKLIDSSIREDNFFSVKGNNKIIISFDDFHKKYRKHFQFFQNSSLKIYHFDEALPDELQQLTFIKQLMEIGDIPDDDLGIMVDYTSKMLKAKSNINTWQADGDITDFEFENLRGNTILMWENKWKRKYRKSFDELSHNDLALDIIDDMRENPISFDILPNDLSISNGYLYHLSDIPCLGWRKDWDKYKK
ncbi:hypothetical protein [Aliivibrio logei]|uniref:CD-NTase associated protein 4-like DNA endonuclease domain-containing protein n=1 Tax=Aliivibrio logei TaxID=688 RepID=A0A1B9NZN0_ALILO|nr:hypothetical protein [Aliivibrio logei]OCH21563.1 hypothetical protein A6E04_06760 [Aliivibrio logei]